MKPILAVALAAALAGCAAPSEVPRDQFYRLTVPAPARLARPPLPGVVQVTRLLADGLTSERAVVFSYRDRPDEIESYAHMYWADPPGTMLSNQLVEVLRAAGAGDQVVTSEVRVPADWVVQGHLKRFEQVAGERPGVLADLELGVTRVRGNTLVLLADYRAERPTSGLGLDQAAAAFDQALAEIFSRFLADVARVRDQNP